MEMYLPLLDVWSGVLCGLRLGPTSSGRTNSDSADSDSTSSARGTLGLDRAGSGKQSQSGHGDYGN